MDDGSPRRQRAASTRLAAKLIEALDNPTQLWGTAFRTHISARCRHLIFSLFFCSEYGASIDELRHSYLALHPYLCGKYGLPHDPKDFEEALRILEGGFISNRNRHVSFVNPSIRDYLTYYLGDASMLIDFATCAERADWAEQAWRHGRKLLAEEELGQLALAFAKVADEFPTTPTRSKSVSFPTVVSTSDLSNSDRVLLLLEWWEASRHERFADLAIEMVEDPSSEFDRSSDGYDLVEIIKQLRSEYYSGFPYVNELANALEKRLVDALSTGLASDDLGNVLDAIDSGGDMFSDFVAEAATEAIRQEISDTGWTIAQAESESTLDDHVNWMQKWGPRAGIAESTLESTIEAAGERIEALREAAAAAEPPELDETPT